MHVKFIYFTPKRRQGLVLFRPKDHSQKPDAECPS